MYLIYTACNRLRLSTDIKSVLTYLLTYLLTFIDLPLLIAMFSHSLSPEVAGDEYEWRKSGQSTSPREQINHSTGPLWHRAISSTRPIDWSISPGQFMWSISYINCNWTVKERFIHKLAQFVCVLVRTACKWREVSHVGGELWWLSILCITLYFMTSQRGSIAVNI